MAKGKANKKKPKKIQKAPDIVAPKKKKKK